MTGLRTLFFGTIAALAVGLTDAAAFDLSLPVGARLTAERETPLDSFFLPLAGFDGAEVPSIELEGRVSRRAWRITTAGLTPLQVLVPLREQAEAAGYDLLFECASQTCGGFDFRFGVEVLPGPGMYVNIARFSYLSATRGPADAPVEAIGILVSVAAEAAYVQLIHADTGIDRDELVPAQEPAPTEIEELAVDVVLPDANLVEDELRTYGHTILGDLEFETGTSGLSAGPYPSLELLAQMLNEDTTLRVVLVGHTDAVGGLEANVELSRNRARAVRERLIETYGVAADQLAAEGMGYLAPVASNLTDAGREKNRRVEAVLLNVAE